MFCGLMKQMIAAIAKRPPKIAPQPAHAVGDRHQHELLRRGDGEHDADDEPDGGDGRPVELQDDERRDDPRDAEDEVQPPEAGGLLVDLRLFTEDEGGVAHFRACDVNLHKAASLIGSPSVALFPGAVIRVPPRPRGGLPADLGQRTAPGSSS